ncbi:Krr1-domain-containing protein [Wallemia mellicola]|uniref:Krr1-domain-containing protein n=1 Tax=Wallemia mellicola TaxID=1708541 RepID=A0A4T0MP10_9BASI|nr:hypothetical protein E3Q24_03202 [Wallemia mellicola]TIB82605.1 Krr1-domain-containing protein [Wallemia mellicola]TIB85325.1 Krr1-domain-containing protein [Wallemia mellicola]TIB97432.1 Krr1-domain-containing protein [Wallemia mellicola]TIC02645.1 Krr1-domain-containing protein [Wallemia mellicola]
MKKLTFSPFLIDSLIINRELNYIGVGILTNLLTLSNLHTVQEKYGDNFEDDDESDDSDMSSEDEDGELLTADVDAALLKTLSLLKSKDPSIYSDKKVFEEEQKKLKDKAAKLNVKRTKSTGKPLTLADLEREKLLKGELSDEEDNDAEDDNLQPFTHVQEQRNLKKEVTSAFHGNDDDDEDDFLKPKTVEDDDNYQTRGSYRKFLLESVGEDEIRKALGLDDQRISSTKEEIESASKPSEPIEKESKKSSKTTAKPSKAEQKAKDDKFLMDYILNQGWMPGSSASVPRDFTVSDAKAAEEGTSVNLSGANANHEIIEDDEEFDEHADEWEHKYNFRFEEPQGDDVKTHSRQLDSTVRRPDNKRKEQRAAKKERKEKEKQQREEELKRLKSLKKDELKHKLAVLGEDASKFENLDLDAEFDPDAHDKAMREAYENDDDYDDEFGDEKPTWDDDIDIGDIVDAEDQDGDDINMDADFDQDDGRITMSKRERKKAKKKAKAEAKNASKEDYDGDDIDMDADHMQGQEEEPIPATAEERQAALEQWLDEYYKLDYEDTIGDLKTRFKYTNVVPDNYGLTTDEILRAEDKDLTRLMRVKRMAPYRKDHIANSGKGKYANGMMSRVREFKHKVNNERAGWGEDPKEFQKRKQASGNKRQRDDTQSEPPAKKKKIGKRERQKRQKKRELEESEAS